MPNGDFFTSCGAHVNCAIMSMLYTHSIGNQPYNMMAVFKTRDSVPSVRYSPICNVCVYGESGSSLLIESTDSVIIAQFTCAPHEVQNRHCCFALGNGWLQLTKKWVCFPGDGHSELDNTDQLCDILDTD